MIYKYPEEFIVPVIYINDMKDEIIDRHKKSQFSYKSQLILSDKELEDNKMFLEKCDMCKDKYIDFDNIDKENSHCNNTKSILEDIDNEYANNETSDIKI